MPFRVKKQLLTAQSLLNDAGYLNEGDCESSRYITLIVAFGAGTSAGVVTIESSHDKNYAGTWVAESVVTWAAASKAHVVRLVGPNIVVRARISTAIVGGTVDCIGVGN